MKIMFAVLALLPLMQGCSPEKTQTYGDPYVHFPDGQATLRGFTNWDVQCRSMYGCPENVGQFVIKESATDVGVCTAFLVDSKTIVTNTHCVTHLTEGADCSEQAEIVFPSTRGFVKETRLCGHLVAKTDKPQFSDPDLAVIELKDETKRFPIVIDSTGVEDQQLLTAYKIDPSGNAYNNTLVKDTCRVVMHPFYLPSFTSGDDATIAFTDCTTIHGNSGSPLVDSQGRVKAVLFGDIEKDSSLASIYDHLRQRGYDLAPKSELDHPDLQNRHLNLATNAACLRPLPPVSIDLQHCRTAVTSPSTSADAQAESSADSKARSHKVLAETVAKLGVWAQAHSDFVVWTGDVKTVGDDIVLRPKMLCVQPATRWISQYTQKGWIFTSYVKQASQYFENAPLYRLQKRYDESLRPYFDATTSLDSIGLDFSPKNLMKDKGGEIEIRRISEPAPEPSFSDIALGRTPHAPIETVPACGHLVSPAEIAKMYAQ